MYVFLPGYYVQHIHTGPFAFTQAIVHVVEITGGIQAIYAGMNVVQRHRSRKVAVETSEKILS